MSDEVRRLEERIRYHQEKYYNGEAEIPDEEFDALWDTLKTLDPGNPVFQKVGEDAADGYPKVPHVIPMGSQEKASDPDEFLKWATKIAHPAYIVQYKMDGASIELAYEKGRFVRGVTRGDGLIGDDITANVARMNGCVKRIDPGFSGAVRGEVLMSHEVHDAHFADKANCRNAANGLMKRKDGEGVDKLDIIVYDAGSSDPDSPPGGLFGPSFFTSELEKLAWLEKQGFTVVEYRVLATPQEVVEYRAAVMDKRAGLPYDIDGLVVKGDSIDAEDMKRARPEKQIAFKFSLEEAISTLRSVEWSESGSLYTPIGVIDPVRLAGTTVKRANLCNPAMLESLDLRIGSRIVITKRGEIIPKIECLVENPPGSTPIELPSVCGSCGSALVNEGTRLYCPNPACDKKLLHRLEKWVAVLGIMDFGSVIIEKLFSSGRVRQIADLYTLTESELAEYDRMGEILARKLLKNLFAVSEIRLSRFVAGFDIEGIGELMAEKAVAAGFSTLEKLRGATVDELAAVDGFGEISAKAVLEGLAAVSGPMDDLIATGKIAVIQGGSGGPLSGVSFCFTGELTAIKRQDAERRVRDLGGTAKSSVTKDLSYLVTNTPNSGSGKNKKARELEVAIIDEAAFLALLEEKTR